MLSYGGVYLTLPTPRQVAWLSSTFTLRRLTEFNRAFWPLNRTPWLTFPGQAPDRPLKLGALTWPRGASRFATFFAVVTDDILAAIRAQGAPAQPLPLSLGWDDAAAGTTVATVAPLMWMLPALPLSQIEGQNGHNLLTLVDDRYWWWFRPAGVVSVDGVSTTWDQLYSQLAAALNAPFAWDAIDPAYLIPSDLLATNYEYLPPLLDAVAYNVGQRVVRYLNGAAKGRSVLQGAADVAANLSLPAARSLMAGGTLFPSDVLASIPASALVSFPTLSGGVLQPTPFVAVGSAGGGAAAVKSFHDTAIYDGGNANILNALAARVALDYGAASVQVGDWKFAGVVPWSPDPIHDAVEWVVTAEGGPSADGEVSTRIYPAPWNDLTDQLLHGSDAGSTAGGCCQTTPQPGCGITVVNDCTLTASPGLSNCLVFNQCDGTLNIWVNNEWFTYCPCSTSGTSGKSGATGNPSGPCQPGFCSICVNPPWIFTVQAVGFTGQLAPLNGTWVLFSQDNCRWSASKVVAGVTYYASYILTNTNEVLGFADVTHGTVLAIYESGVGINPTPGNCCSTAPLKQFFILGGTGGGGTGAACVNCPGQTPAQWSFDLTGATGVFATLNGAWALTQNVVSPCSWSATNAHGDVVTMNIGAGTTWLSLSMTPAVFPTNSANYTVNAQGDCCQPQTTGLFSLLNPSGGTVPTDLLITPTCEGGGNGGPPTLTAVPTCCPVVPSGGSGGGSVYTTCCPGGLPTTLYARFTGALASLGTVQMNWTGTAWQNVSALACGVPVGAVSLSCTGGSPPGFTMACLFFVFFSVGPLAASSCAPFSWTASGTSTGNPPAPCANGAFSVTVTLT